MSCFVLTTKGLTNTIPQHHSRTLLTKTGRTLRTGFKVTGSNAGKSVPHYCPTIAFLTCCNLNCSASTNTLYCEASLLIPTCNETLKHWIVLALTQPQRIISGLRQTFIKRYVVERTNKAELTPEQQLETINNYNRTLSPTLQFDSTYAFSTLNYTPVIQ